MLMLLGRGGVFVYCPLSQHSLQSVQPSSVSSGFTPLVLVLVVNLGKQSAPILAQALLCP